MPTPQEALSAALDGLRQIRVAQAQDCRRWRVGYLL